MDCVVALFEQKSVGTMLVHCWCAAGALLLHCCLVMIVAEGGDYRYDAVAPLLRCCCVAVVLLLRSCCVGAMMLLRCCCVDAVLLLRCCCVAAMMLLRCCCVAAVLLLLCCCVAAKLLEALKSAPFLFRSSMASWKMLLLVKTKLARYDPPRSNP